MQWIGFKVGTMQLQQNPEIWPLSDWATRDGVRDGAQFVALASSEPGEQASKGQFELECKIWHRIWINVGETPRNAGKR